MIRTGSARYLGDISTFEEIFSMSTICPRSGSTAVDVNGINYSFSGTQTARTLSYVDSVSRMIRTGYVSAATAGAVCGFKTGNNHLFIGDGSGNSGFIFSGSFGISDSSLVSGARMFCGVSFSAAQSNVEPSTVQLCVGVAQLSTDATQLYVVYSTLSTKTPIPLGADFPISKSIAYKVCISASETKGVVLTVKNMSTGKLFSVSFPITEALSLSTSVSPNFWRSNNATAQAVGIDIGNIGFCQV